MSRSLEQPLCAFSASNKEVFNPSRGSIILQPRDQQPPLGAASDAPVPEVAALFLLSVVGTTPLLRQLSFKPTISHWERYSGLPAVSQMWITSATLSFVLAGLICPFPTIVEVGKGPPEPTHFTSSMIVRHNMPLTKGLPSMRTGSLTAFKVNLPAGEKGHPDRSKLGALWNIDQPLPT